MASKVSSTSNLPWTWVIEALSCSKQVDTSLLIDIVKSAPEISEDLEKNVREIVTLRILVGLAAKGNQMNDNDTPTQGQKTKLDMPNSSEDVLRHILEEMSAADPKTVGPELLNLDVQSFVVHNRASFPMRALQKLKEAILEGGYSVLASLKERSGLAVRTQCGDEDPVNLGDSICLAQRLEENYRHTSQSWDEESIEDLPDGILSPTKSIAADISPENGDKRTYEDQINLEVGCAHHVEGTMKFKQDSSFVGGTLVENSIASPLHRQLTNVSEGIVQHAERYGLVLQNEVEVGPSTHPNKDDKLEENLQDMNSLPAKRNLDDASGGNLDRQFCEGKGTSGDDNDTYSSASRKFKLDADFHGNNIVEKPIASPLHGLSANVSEGNVQFSEREVCNMQIEVEVGSATTQKRDEDLQEKRLDRKLLPSKRNRETADVDNLERQTYDDEMTLDDGCDFNAVAAKKFKQDVKATGVNVVENPMASPIGGILTISAERIVKDVATQQSTSNKTCSVGMEKERSLENATHGFGSSFQQNASGIEGKDDMEHNPDMITTSDSEACNDERMDIALKKGVFISSQCTYSQDSCAMEQNRCIKCNRDGQLLVCSSSSCQLVVHESCLHSAAKFNGNGKFYCPFCAYSRAISEYLQVKRKASLARRDFAMFIGVRTDCRPKYTLRSDGAKHCQSRKNDEFGFENEGNIDDELVNVVNNSQHVDNVEKNHQAETPISCSGDNLLGGEKMGLTNETAHISGKRNLEREDVMQNRLSPGGILNEPRASKVVHKSNHDLRKCNLIDRIDKNRELPRKKVSDPPESALHNEQDAATAASSKQERDKPVTSKYSDRLRKPKGQKLTQKISSPGRKSRLAKRRSEIKGRGGDA